MIPAPRHATRLQRIALTVLLLGAGLLDALAPGLRVDGVEVKQAVINFWVQIALLVVSYVIAVATAPKPKKPEPQKGEVPNTKDGKRVVRIFGTVWRTEPEILAMQQIDPPDPIRTKGGKK